MADPKYTRKQIIEAIEEELDWFFNQFYDGGDVPGRIRELAYIFAAEHGYHEEWAARNFVSDYFSPKPQE